MPKNKKNKNNTTAKIIGIILLVLLAFAGGFFIAQRFTGGNNNNSTEPENNQAKTDKPTVIESSNGTQIDKPEDIEEKDKTPAKYDGEDPNTLESLTGIVTYSGVTNGKLVIRVNIDQYLGSGSCSISIGDYSNTVNIVPSASTSTCEGFDIPLTDLGNLSGNVEFKINLVSGDKVGSISGEVGV